MQIEKPSTRLGLFDLRAELTTLRERGLPNRTQLRVIERITHRVVSFVHIGWTTLVSERTDKAEPSENLCSATGTETRRGDLTGH
jgi:hypothetical protein